MPGQKMNLRELSPAELHAKVDGIKEDLRKKRFQNMIGQLASSADILKVRRDAARCLTIIRETEIREAKKAKP